MIDPLQFVRPDFDELEAYKPVLPLEELAREIGCAPGELAKLDANENLYGPAPSVLEAIANADHHIYPDPGSTGLREGLADYLGVGPGMIVCGAGSDDLIDILIRLCLPRAIAIAPPTFGMYSFLAKISRVGVIEASRKPDFSLDYDAIRTAVADGAKLVFLASPNNPTGNLCPDPEIRKLCELDALVVVDEAYAEFAGHSAVPLIREHPNLVVLRTFSKWAGLAGLRVGYSVADPGLSERMMAIKQPYNVNVAADVAARAALAHRGEVMESVRMLVAERDSIVERLAAFPYLHPYPSSSNFVLFRVEGRDAGSLAQALRRDGVLVRHYNTAALRGCIRISAGRPQDTDRLVDALARLENA